MKVKYKFSTPVNVSKTVNSTDYNAYDVVILGNKSEDLRTVFHQVSKELILNVPHIKYKLINIFLSDENVESGLNLTSVIEALADDLHQLAIYHSNQKTYETK